MTEPILPTAAEDIFGAALYHRMARERRAFVAQACGDNSELLARVEALLKAHDEAGGPVRPAAMDAGSELSPTLDTPTGSMEAVGLVVDGRYRLLELVGEGGMGSVWVAQQTAPVRRKVAVKLIKPGMDSKHVLTRFQAERQALAIMDHPNIAKVLDGGVSEQGRPYFVMEYVKGVPITQYCDESKASLADRLQLFVQVCQAVQHAHQKGIIHRDLKPSNILVCLYDGQPVPKVIDFGLAKAMHQSLTEQSVYTAHGVMVGTPLYMSPEQAEFNNLDIDTRSDIYSLGVVLYELLTGSTPLERQQLKDAVYQEVLRLIKEVEPPKPSTRLSGSASLPSVAAQRGLAPAELRKSVQGDLDWIVMKALEKERSRRYETANGLARDIERYLNDEAVEACPPSAAYRWKKFARKYRVAIRTGGAFVLLMGLATAVSFWLAARAMRAEGLAEERASEALASAERAEKAELETMEAYRASTDEAIEELIGSKETLGPQEKRYLEKTIERWQAFAERTGGDARGRLLRVEGHLRLGHLWDRFGDTGKASEQFKSARDQAKQLVRDFPENIRYQGALGSVHRYSSELLVDQSKYVEALRESESAIAILTTVIASPSAKLERIYDLMGAYVAAGNALLSLGKNKEAAEKFEAALTHAQELSERDPNSSRFTLGMARCHLYLSRNLFLLNDAAESLRQADQAIAVLKAMPTPIVDSREVLAAAHAQRAVIYLSTDRRQDSMQEKKAALALRKGLAAEFPAVTQFQRQLAEAHSSLATAWLTEGNVEQAISENEQSLKVLRTLTEADPTAPDFKRLIAYVRMDYSQALRTAGRIADATQELRTAIEISQKVAAAHPDDQTLAFLLFQCHKELGLLFQATEQYGEAVEEYRIAVRLGREFAGKFPGLNLFTLEVARLHAALGHALAEMGRFEEGLAELEAVRAMWAKLSGENPKNVEYQARLAETYGPLSETLYRLDRPAEALEKTRSARDQYRALREAHPEVVNYRAQYLSNEAELAARVGSWRAAVDHLTEWVKVQPDFHYAWFLGAYACASLGDREEYERHCRAMLERFGTTTNAYVAQRTAKACSLMPGAKIDTGLVRRLADLSIEETTDKDLYRDHLLSAQSMALYRDGKFEKAIEVATRSLAQPGVDHGVIEGPSQFVLCMAHWRLGHADEARRALEAGRAKISSIRKGAKPSDLVSVYWHDESMGLLLLKECEALVGGENAAR